MDKLKVLMIGPGRDVMGGISTVVNKYYEAKLDDKVDLKYIATMEDGSKLKKLFVAISAYMKFCRSISKYDIIHVHMASRNSYERKKVFINKAFKSHKKVIIHLHGSEFHMFYDKECSKEKQKEVRNIFSKADKVIVLSEEWKDYISKLCDPKNIEVVHNSVVISGTKSEMDNHNILFLGRLGTRKGVYDLLDCMEDIVKQVPNVKLYLAGDGEIENCRTIIEKRNLENNVELCGWISGDQKKEYMKKCAIFVLPSYNEGMPMSLLEAMAYGMAVVTSNVGGIPQIMKGDCGIMLDPGDIDKMKQSLLELLTDKDRKQQLGTNAFKVINDRFNLDKNILKVISIYQSI